MTRNLRVLLVFAASVAALTSASAASELRTIRNPGGGQIVYGTVDGVSSEAAAMASVLRSVHRLCGDRPSVGRVFSVRRTGSEAVFFTVTNRPQHNLPVAGLIIAARVPGHVEAALVSDDASRFGATVDPMLRTLVRVWHPQAPPRPGGRPALAPGGTAAVLHRVQALDGSASAGLPAGWALNPVSRQGTLIANGPHGERVTLGSALLAMDSNNPRVAQTEAFAMGAGRNTSYARAMYYPHGDDMGATFVAVLQRMRANLGVPPARLRVTSEAAAQASYPARCARLGGEIDPGDGERSFDALFCSGGESPMGQFMNLVNVVTIPERFAASERATSSEIIGSYVVDASVVGAQASRMAAPEIARIHAIGRAAAQAAANAHAAEDAHNAAVERHWDSEDRSSQAFSNYLLDQTVISDSAATTHATVWNSTADAMVRSDPTRYQYVSSPNFWKGTDY